MDIALGFLIGFFLWFIAPRGGGRHLHRRSERARGEDQFRTRRARARARKPRWTIPSPDSLAEDERTRYIYPQVRVILPGGPVFQNAVGEGPQSFARHHDHQHGARSGKSERQRERHAAGGRDQRPAQHRADRPDPLPREREQSVRVSVRHQAAVRSRDGIFRLGAAAAHRQFRSQAESQAAAAEAPMPAAR